MNNVNIYLNSYNKNVNIIENKKITLEFNDKKIILNKENNYLNLLNNFISNIENNKNKDINNKYNYRRKTWLYYDYFKNNNKEEINKNNLTNYLINCILYYVYNFEKDKINKLNEIIYNNFKIKYDKTNHIKIYFQKSLFNDIFNLNLKLKIKFSNFNKLYNKIIISKQLFYCYYINEENKYINKDDNKDNDKEIEIYNRYLRNKKKFKIYGLRNIINIIKRKYNIKFISLNNDDFCCTFYKKEIYIKDGNNDFIKDNNNEIITINRYILYIKLNKDIKELNLKENDYLGIINEKKYNYIKTENKNYYIVSLDKSSNKWIILNLYILDSDIICDHSLTVYKFLNYYNYNE